MTSDEYRDPNHKWLNNAPTAGDATGGQRMYGGGGGLIDVTPDGVKLFSTQADGEAKDTMANYNDGVRPLMGQSARIGASFVEAADFGTRHGQGSAVLEMFNMDASLGMTALGNGARTIALNYLNADITSAATMTDVQNAFDTSGGRGFLDAAGGPPTPTGQDNPVGLPDGQPVNPQDYRTDPDGSRTIDLGSQDSYTMPAAGADDLERLDRDDVQNLNNQFRDDLADQEHTPAPYNPEDYR